MEDSVCRFAPTSKHRRVRALEASIKAEGVRDKPCVDEDGNVLDGRHRLKIDPDTPVRTIRGLSDAEKKAFVYRANFSRRNLSPEQKRAELPAMKAIANEFARRRRQEEHPEAGGGVAGGGAEYRVNLVGIERYN